MPAGMRDQVTLDLHAWRYPGERERLQRATAGSRSQVNPARPITRTKIAAAASVDHWTRRPRRRARCISPKIGARVDSSRSPGGRGSSSIRSGAAYERAATTGSSSLTSAWQTGQLFRCVLQGRRAHPHRACRAGTRRSVPGSGYVLRVESSGPLPLLQHQAQRLQAVVEAATHGANRDTGLGGDLRAGPVAIVGLHYRVTVVWT